MCCVGCLKGKRRTQGRVACLCEDDGKDLSNDSSNGNEGGQGSSSRPRGWYCRAIEDEARVEF